MPADGFLPGNRLIEALPAEARQRLAPEFEHISIRSGDVLHRAGQSADYVYWPHSGMGSIVSPLGQEASIAVASIGSEGMIGVFQALGGGLSTERSVVLVSGEAARVRIGPLRAELERNRELRALLSRYAQLLAGHIARGAACNRAHHIEARCARWLLSAHDCVAGDQFPMTHEVLARTLGVRRAGVSVAQHKLMKQGLIDYSRGIVTIVDRAGLEAGSCDCHRVLRGRYESFYSFNKSDRRRVTACASVQAP
jgi:CRP-like cAMP-binding protein